MSYTSRALPTIIDIEASGFGADSYPIEIGIVTANSQRYCRLIKPEPEWTQWSDDAQECHGLSRDVLQTFGKSAKVVCCELNDLLSGSTVYSDALSHDQRWLMKLFYTCKVVQRFHLSSIESIASEEQLRNWDETKAHVIKRLNAPRHRASHDALIIQQTFLETDLVAG